MTTDQANRVAEHLRKTGQGFCFINGTELVSREYLTEQYGITFED